MIIFLDNYFFIWYYNNVRRLRLMENIIINIHEDNLSIFNEKLADLNAKFSKKGLPLINCSMEQKEMEHVDEWTKEKFSYTMYVATLSSDFNQTNLSGVDVEFEGVVSLVEGNENDKVYTFKNINYSSLLANCSCDKCHKKIGRNKYLVFSKVGKEVETRDDLVVLGTSCAKDYFPFSVESYFGFLESAFEELGSYDEFSGSFGNCVSHYHSLRSIHNAMCAVSENYKIYKKEGVTKSDVFGWMNNDKINKFDRYRDVFPMPTSPVSFEDIISWVDEMYNKDDLFGDFNYNARSVFYKTLDDGTRELRHEIHDRFVGIAVYAFFSAKQNHDKMVAKKIAEEERAKANAEVTYYGNVGDKFEHEMTFEKIFGFETMYGYQYILLFHDEENHVFKWSSSRGTYQCWCKTNGRDGFLEYEVGKKYILKGTIKAHEEYRNVKQTVITRCKVLKDEYESHVFSKKEIEKIMESKESVENTVPYEDPFDTLMEAMDSVEQSA